MDKFVPSLSQGLHESQRQPVQDIDVLAGMSEKDRVRFDYGKQRDMSKVTVFPAKKVPGLYDHAGKLRVVVYCRVSTDGLAQTSSFELQRNYYLKFVRKRIQWQLVAMYSDEGITATSTKKRIGLLQMLEDAKAGKFDVIIVKNLSRLSRNLMDCMNIIYALRSLPNPVGIFFETENLYTLDKTADFTLQVLSLVAQEESHKKSEAMLASYFMRFSQGQYMVPDLLGYDRVGKNLIAINVEEAKTVQLVFMMYLAGYSPKTIAYTLTELQRKTHVHITLAGEKKGGEVKWTPGSVMNILTNERRCGDVLAQKTVTESYLTHKTKKNIDTLPKFYAKDQHPGIVNPEDFLLTQRLIAANRGGWSGQLPDMRIYSEGALRGFVSVVPRWCGYSAEDYNRAALRAYGFEEAELAQMGGAVEVSREQQILGKTGQPASESQEFQYKYNIDSEDYNLYPDTPDVQESNEDMEEMEVFAEHVKKMQTKLAAEGVDKRTISSYDLTGCEKLRAELFSLTEKVCFTVDKNGIVFNAFARKKLCGDNDRIEHVEIAYNPILQMMLVRKAEEGLNSLQWVRENKNNHMEMRRCKCRGFANALYDNMGWNLDYKYKIVGTYMIIDGSPALIFTLDDPIKIVPFKVEEEQTGQFGSGNMKKTNRRQTKELLEAGFAPEDIRLPSMPEIDLGNDTLNERAKNAARSRAIYFDSITSASGMIHVSDLGEQKFNPECIRQILQKNRMPEEGWSYLRGMAVIRKKSFTIYPESWHDSFGNDVYSNWRKFNPEGKIVASIPYGWTQALVLPTEETVQKTIEMLREEMEEGLCS